MNNGPEWRAPMLNIRATRDLIADHSDIYRPEFVSFVRELYMDTLIRDIAQLGTVRYPEFCAVTGGK
jgi:hypothetical protein